MKVLVTGAAGFIGSHVALRLLDAGAEVVGVDDLNTYYDPALKRARLRRLEPRPGFAFRRLDVADRDGVARLFAEHPFERVCHLAAQAGVRWSIQQPHAYADANLVGFLNLLEGCRHGGVRHLVYASSSSVYGGATKQPFAETDPVDHPVSLYAATKKANELMAHAYAHLYALPATGLRLFTVYGPWGRPDMAAWLFADAIAAGRPVRVFNHGAMKRDFTFIDDAVEAIVRVMDRPPAAAAGVAPHRVLNVGNADPVPLLEFVTAIGHAFGRVPELERLPMQDGDVPETFADTTALQALTGFSPGTPVPEGVRRFVDWYREYHGR